MKIYFNLLNDSSKKLTIVFIVLNIILVFVETFSIALIPLVIDFAINENPLLPRYINFFENHLSNLEKSDIRLPRTSKQGILFFLHTVLKYLASALSTIVYKMIIFFTSLQLETILSIWFSVRVKE